VKHLLILVVLALTAIPERAFADEDTYVCQLNQYAYRSVDGSSYEMCYDACHVETPQGEVQGDCYQQPPSGGGGPDWNDKCEYDPACPANNSCLCWDQST